MRQLPLAIRVLLLPLSIPLGLGMIITAALLMPHPDDVGEETPVWFGLLLGGSLILRGCWLSGGRVVMAMFSLDEEPDC